jgi:hypothetical protein
MRLLRKRVWFWLLILMSSIIAAALWMSWPKEPLLGRITRIHEGMTLQEIEAILGPPNIAGTPHCKSWRDEHTVVSIYFDGAAQSISVADICEEEKPPGVLDRVRGWLTKVGM